MKNIIIGLALMTLSVPTFADDCPKDINDTLDMALKTTYTAVDAVESMAEYMDRAGRNINCMAIADGYNYRFKSYTTITQATQSTITSLDDIVAIFPK